MSVPSVYINDVDLESLGVRVQGVTGPWDSPELTDTFVTIPGRDEAVITNLYPDTPVRTVQITGTFVRDLADRAAFLGLLRQVKALLQPNLLELRLADQPTLIYYCKASKSAVQPFDPHFVTKNATFTISLTCVSPLAFEQTPLGIALGAVRVAVPVGDGRSAGWIRVVGPTTNHVITYRAPSGEVLGTMGFTRSLGGGADPDYQDIDLSLQTVARYVAGVAQPNALDDLTSGYFFNPGGADGDVANGHYPTLEIAGVDAGGSCVYYFRRAWP